MSIYEKRDEAALIEAAARSGKFPAGTKNHLNTLFALKERVARTNELSTLRNRLMVQQVAYNNFLELQRQRGVLASRRMPGLQGTIARIAQLENMRQRINPGTPADDVDPARGMRMGAPETPEEPRRGGGAY
jgi:hypothetical protein